MAKRKKRKIRQRAAEWVINRQRLEPTPEQQEWLQENVFRKCNAKKIVPENCDEIMTYIQTHYEYPLRQRLKNKTNEELKFINELMSSLAYFMDSQDIF